MIAPSNSPSGPARPKDRLAAALLTPLVVLLLMLLIPQAVFRSFAVDGPSMLPTLRQGDRLFVTRGYGEPRRGDIVVLEVSREGIQTDLVKRVVAIGGDDVTVFGDLILVNGVPALGQSSVIASTAPQEATVTVPPGFVYVAGDNRPESLDSRHYGPVPEDAVLGRAVAIYSPVTRLGLIRAPEPD
ncbi:MAG: signal peptidase I [Coriobacteriia bacterium]